TSELTGSDVHTEEFQNIRIGVQDRDRLFSRPIQRARVDPPDPADALIALHVRVAGDEIIMLLVFEDALEASAVVAMGDGEALAVEGDLAEFIEALDANGFGVARQL